MYIVSHGGFCCGMSTIFNMGYNPTANVGPMPPLGNQRSAGSSVSKCIYPHEAPEETYLARLDRYLAWIDTFRSKGVIEITLAGSQLPGALTQQSAWHDLLIERGFKAVTEFVNSNSGNTVTIYHRSTGPTDKKTAKVLPVRYVAPTEVVAPAVEVTEVPV